MLAMAPVALEPLAPPAQVRSLRSIGVESETQTHTRTNRRRPNQQASKMIAPIAVLALAVLTLQCDSLVASDDTPSASVSDEEISVDASAQRPPGAQVDPFSYTFEDYLRELGDASAGEHRKPQDINDSQKQQQQQQQQENEIRMQFAWKRTPTSRCSKSCGGGRRLYHLSCVDLKYGVRVEEALCRRQLTTGAERRPVGANIGDNYLFSQSTPSELSDEPCNQIDCEPQWSELTVDAINNDTNCNSDPDCGGSKQVYKRLECQMIDRWGKRVPVDEWRCGDLPPRAQPATTRAPPVAAPASASSSLIEDEQLVLDDNRIVVSGSNDEPKSFSADNLIHQAHKTHQPHGQHHHQPTSGEPHYVAGEWTECSGAQCGQLGRRSRKLTCRIYLARSSKFAEIPLSSCEALALVPPDTEQPCYMDCPPEVDTSSDASASPPAEPDEVKTETESSNSTDAHTGVKDDNSGYGDETVYDLDVARYVWRRDDWTQCSAECLGGERESIVECWDKVAAQPVDPVHCSELPRPDVLVEICNERPCAPEWRTEPFDESPECSRPCGSAGVRTRTVVCVQQVRDRTPSTESGGRIITNAKGEHWLIVPDEFCARGGAGPMPARSEPCNRWDCEPKWHLGQWSECSRRCGLGVRNRTATCVQEFASRDSPVGQREPSGSSVHRRALSSGWRPRKIPSPDLLEAMALSALDWHPGKLTQVPFKECFDHYRSVPTLEEQCYGHECNADFKQRQELQQQQQPIYWIDSEPAQDYRMSMDLGANTRRRTVTLKVGGRARVLEGKNVKFRCRLMHGNRRYVGQIGSASLSHRLGATRQPSNSQVIATSVDQHNASSAPKQQVHLQRVEWRKDGVRIFADNSTMAEIRPIVFDDGNDNETADSHDQAHNSIWADQVLLADQPSPAGAPTTKDPPSSTDEKRPMSAQPDSTTDGVRPRARVKNTRSLRAHNSLTSGVSNFEFVPQTNGRFTLIKDNTLRVKRLRAEDSGLYTCHWGSLQESIELSVVSRRELVHYEDNM